jgi:hypothetical protein
LPSEQLQLERESSSLTAFVFFFNFEITMVAHILEVVMQYEERKRRLQKVPRFSYGLRMVRADGGPNRLFFFILFNDHAMAIGFLKEIGLLRRTMQRDSCSRDMTWSKRPKLHAGFIWQCQRRVAGVGCSQSVHQAWVMVPVE